jgi:predicted phosphodiesterase
MVRILAAGDFHDDKRSVKRIAKKALDEKVDLIH